MNFMIMKTSNFWHEKSFRVLNMRPSFKIISREIKEDFLTNLDLPLNLSQNYMIPTHGADNNAQMDPTNKSSIV